MSEENKNLFVELPEGATEKNQKEWQKMINTWNEHGEEPFVGRPLGLDNIQKANAYWDGMECLAKGGRTLRRNLLGNFQAPQAPQQEEDKGQIRKILGLTPNDEKDTEEIWYPFVFEGGYLP